MGKKSERRERRTAAALTREAEERGALIEERRRRRAEADAAADRAEQARHPRIAPTPQIPEALGLEGPDRLEAPLLSIEPRPRVASIHPEPWMAPPRSRRSGMSRALLALAMLSLGGLPRDPGEG